MKNRYLLFLILPILSSSCATQVLVGKYVSDETKNKSLISTIEIKNDSTFLYTKSGDLYFEESEGFWQIKRNKIFLKSFEHYKSPCLKQTDLNAGFPLHTQENKSVIFIENKSSLSNSQFKEIKVQIEGSVHRINKIGEIRIEKPFDKILISIPNIGENRYEFKDKSFHNLAFEIINGGCNLEVYLNDSMKLKNKKLMKFDGSVYKFISMP